MKSKRLLFMLVSILAGAACTNTQEVLPKPEQLMQARLPDGDP